MWSVPAKNMKKINMSISFVYDVSIQDNCENAVFTFLPFYKQNIAFFFIFNLPLLCCWFWIFWGWKSVILYVPDNIFYYKGVFNGNYTANPKQGRTHGFPGVL